VVVFLITEILSKRSGLLKDSYRCTRFRSIPRNVEIIFRIFSKESYTTRTSHARTADGSSGMSKGVNELFQNKRVQRRSNGSFECRLSKCVRILFRSNRRLAKTNTNRSPYRYRCTGKNIAYSETEQTRTSTLVCPIVFL